MVVCRRKRMSETREVCNKLEGGGRKENENSKSFFNEISSRVE
ncbi:MAG: hypothetical protein ACI8RD_006263 [Bacillariaceae sp.]|jgi:hypothetical protein